MEEDSSNGYRTDKAHQKEINPEQSTAQCAPVGIFVFDKLFRYKPTNEQAGEETAEQTVEDATEEGNDETAEKPATFKEKTKAVFLAIANAFKKGAQSTGNFFRGLFTKKTATKEEAEAEETPVEDASVQNESSDEIIDETVAVEETETPDEEAPVDDGTDVSEEEEPTAVGAADANQD